MDRRAAVTVSKRIVVASIVAGLMIWSQQTAHAASDGQTHRSDKPTQTPAASTVSTLKGKVVEVDVTLNNLRDARLSISRVRKEAANLYDEVTRQEVVMSHTPNMIGTTVISIPAPRFTGKVLPARKKWVDASMAVLGPIISLFKEDVDFALENNRQTNVSEPIKAKLAPLRSDAFKAVNASFAIYKKLQTLTASTDYDNAAIETEVKSLDTQMKTLDASLKKGIRILQREAKK